MRSISQITGVLINRASKFLADAGRACAAYHDESVRNVNAQRIQYDEIWSFAYAKDKSIKSAIAAPDGFGDAWTWIAIDVDSKMSPSYEVGDCSAATAIEFVDGLRWRH